MCEKCNNDTGSWYGDEYIKILRIIHAIISQSAEIKELLVLLKTLILYDLLSKYYQCFVP